jgi:hypothetical protein
MWEILLGLDSVKDLLLLQEGNTVCVPTLSHLLTYSSIVHNSNLFEVMKLFN